MASDMIQKPVSSPILDRFRDLVREREEELRDLDDEEDVVLTSEEIVMIYEVVLSELTFNSKPIITDLTIIAGEQRVFAEGIADAICARIIEAPVEQKLPSLYLLDSIVKNIGTDYVRFFASRLPEVFVEAYRQVHPNQHSAMRHLFGTWSLVFSSSVLRKIEAELQFSSLANHQSSGSTSLRSSISPSPRPTHGIHVNPKYLEARRQYEHATVINMRVMDNRGDAAHNTSYKGDRIARNASASPEGWSGASSNFDELQDARGISSNLQRLGQKPAVGLGEYDMDNAEIITQQVGIRRVESPGVAARTSTTGAQRRISPDYRHLRSSSPSRVRLPESLSASDDGYTRDISPSRVTKRSSPLHCGFEYAPGRLNKKDGEWGDRWMRHPVDNIRPPVGTNFKSEFDRQRPRALIDAYGNYRGENILNAKPLKIERLEENGINRNTKTWQNTEEEEYVWEDMSPTLADRTRSNDLLSSNFPHRNMGTRAGFGRPTASTTEPDHRAGYWPMQPQLPEADDTPKFSGDGASILDSGLGDICTKSMSALGNQNKVTQIQGSKFSQDPWNVHSNLPPSSQLYPKVSGKTIEMSFPPAGTTMSSGQRAPSVTDNTEVFSSMSQVAGGEKYSWQRAHSPPMASEKWSQINMFPLPLHRQQNQMNGRFDSVDANKAFMNQGANEASILLQQQFDSFERKTGSSHMLSQLQNQSLNNRSQGLVASLQPHVPNAMGQGSFGIPRLAQVPSPLLPQHLNHGSYLQGQRGLTSTMPMNRLSGVRPSIPMYGVPNASFQIQGGTKPPLPPGPPPSVQMGPSSQNVGSVASHPPVADLFKSLLAQGMLTMTTSVSVQDSVGVEFNADILKVRHESSIKALYADLPRQCKTCGLRFKCQEEHSAHMDWHVTKNRVSRNRKQKPSRKWFVSTSLWLSGAETVGSDAIPGFLPNETIIEKKDDEVMAVPADENQSSCALCGEPFDDFYSDETEEWMYKGAVYLNAPDGPTTGIDSSELGPIVHAKCRSESTVISNDDFGRNGGGKIEDDGNQPKRMRV